MASILSPQKWGQQATPAGLQAGSLLSTWPSVIHNRGLPPLQQAWPVPLVHWMQKLGMVQQVSMSVVKVL
jgi:hypothetical protein